MDHDDARCRCRMHVSGHALSISAGQQHCFCIDFGLGIGFFFLWCHLAERCFRTQYPRNVLSDVNIGFCEPAVELMVFWALRPNGIDVLCTPPVHESGGARCAAQAGLR